MLRLRTDQIAALTAAFVCEKPEAYVAYASKYHPDLARELGPEGLLGFVKSGLRQACHHGVRRPRDFNAYLDLVCVLGLDWDASGFGWAAEMLADTRAGSPSERIARVRRHLIYRIPPPEAVAS